MFTTDEEVVKKLKDSHDEKIIEMLNLIRNIDVIEDKDNYDHHFKSKVRCTDPKILIDGKIDQMINTIEFFSLNAVA